MTEKLSAEMKKLSLVSTRPERAVSNGPGLTYHFVGYSFHVKRTRNGRHKESGLDIRREFARMRTNTNYGNQSILKSST